MKSGKLAQVHRAGIKAGDHDHCFKDTSKSSKAIQRQTSIDTVFTETDGPSRERTLVDNAKCRQKGNILAKERKFEFSTFSTLPCLAVLGYGAKLKIFMLYISGISNFY